jgi:CHASE3 domain sensor protein
LEERSVVALLTALILLIGLIAATAWLQYQQRSDQVWVDRTYEIQLRLARIWSLTQTAEIAGRGYVVTGDETYLRPQRGAVSAFHAELSLLAVTMSNNPQQAQSWSQLREAIEARISNIDSMVQLEASGNHADAVALLRSGKGERLMAQVQAAIHDC